MEQFKSQDYPSDSENNKIRKDFDNAKKAMDNLRQGGGVFRNDQEDGASYTKLSAENLPGFKIKMLNDLNEVIDILHLNTTTNEEKIKEFVSSFFEEYKSDLVKRYFDVNGTGEVESFAEEFKRCLEYMEFSNGDNYVAPKFKKVSIGGSDCDFGLIYPEIKNFVEEIYSHLAH